MIMLTLEATTADGAIHRWNITDMDARHCLNVLKPLPDRVPVTTIEGPVHQVWVNPYLFLQWELLNN